MWRISPWKKKGIWIEVSVLAVIRKHVPNEKVQIWPSNNSLLPSRHCWRVSPHSGSSHPASVCLTATAGFETGHGHQHRWSVQLVQMICTQRQWACKGKVKLWDEHWKKQKKSALSFVLLKSMKSSSQCVGGLLSLFMLLKERIIKGVVARWDHAVHLIQPLKLPLTCTVIIECKFISEPILLPVTHQVFPSLSLGPKML